MTARLVFVCREGVPACRDAICLDGCKRFKDCPKPAPLPPPDVLLCEARLRRHIYRCARCNGLYNGVDFSCDCGAELTYWGGEPALVDPDDPWGDDG